MPGRMKRTRTPVRPMPRDAQVKPLFVCSRTTHAALWMSPELTSGGAPMGAFYASVCTVAVAAGILTAAAATKVERLPAREDIAPMVNRIAKADRLRPATAGTIRIRTISIPAAADRQQAAVSRELTACDPLVSPLADPVGEAGS